MVRGGTIGAKGEVLALVPTSPPELRLFLLRGFKLTCNGKQVPLMLGSQRLLAFLALQDRAVPRAYAAGVLWTGVSADRASGNLRSALWRLRRPWPCLVETFHDHLQLHPSVIVDVREGNCLARRLMDENYPGADGDVDQRTLDGELLPGWDDEWLWIERERQKQINVHALETLCERFAQVKRFSAAVLAGTAAVSAEPLRESARRALIKAYLAEGNPSEAIRHYRDYGLLLRKELGVTPSDEMEDILARLRHANPPQCPIEGLTDG